MTIYTYNENCVLAGQIAPESAPEGDVFAHHGTEKEIINEQVMILSSLRQNQFGRRRAKAILEHLRPGEYDWQGNRIFDEDEDHDA